MAYDVFISYSTKDQKIVEGLSAYLEQQHIRCFAAYRDIPKGVVWAKVIAEAIDDCKIMVVVFSEHFNRSEQVDREIKLCVEEGKPILTFKIQDTAFSGAKKYYLKNINWIDAFPNPESYFGELHDSLKRLLPVKQAVGKTIKEPMSIGNSAKKIDYVSLADQCFKNKDYERAVYWYARVAKEEDSARRKLFEIFSHDDIITTFSEEVFLQFKPDAEEDLSYGLFIMGKYYALNKKNEMLAFEYIYRATFSENEYAELALGHFYFNGIGIGKNDAEAFNCYHKSAEKGCSGAQYWLGHLYHNGHGVTTDNTKAWEWYEKAAEQGYAEAQNMLGYMYRFGFGVAMDRTKAIEWYRKAAEQNHTSAQNSLGYMYQHYYGVTKDYAEAVRWYRKAAEQNNASAQYSLGKMYQCGYGVTKDYTKAVEWYRKAVEQNNAAAQNNLGYMYRNGYGITKDHTKAVEWYQKAAKQGNKSALDALGRLGIKM